jgi:uncharacterized protein involved in exopolysaccharide biosynthesis
MNEEFNLLSFYKLLRERIKLIIIILIVGVSLTAAYSFIMPQQYKAKTVLMPPQKESSGGGGLSGFLQSIGGGGMPDISIPGMGGSSNKQLLFASVLKSRSIAKYITDSLNLKQSHLFKGLRVEDIYNLLTESIDVEVEKSGLLTVEVVVGTGYFPGGKDAKEAARLSSEIANKSIEALNYIVKSKNIISAQKTKKYIEKALLEFRFKLDSVERALQDFKVKNKILELDAQTKAILEQAVGVGSELTKAEIELNLAEQEYDDNAPKVKLAESSVDVLRDQYNKIQSGGITTTDAFSIPLEKIPELERIYTSLVRDQKILTQVLLYLSTQKHQEAIQVERELPVIESLDDAIVPEKRFSPSRGIMVILSAIISFTLAVLFVFADSINKGRLYLKKSES